MTNNFLNHVQQKIEEIYPQIQYDSRGVLHQVIYKLEKNKINAREICEHFAIKESSKIEDDLGILYDNIAVFFIDVIRTNSIKLNILNIDLNTELKTFKKSVFVKIYSFLEYKKQMEIIVITAIILISVFMFTKSKSKTKKQHSQALLESENPISYCDSATAICLVVPASAVFYLTEKQSVNRNEIIQLIDVASDFLCIGEQEANDLSVDIDRNQVPASESQSKFYIRIDIFGEQDIIGTRTKHVIKRDLPYVEGKVKELGSLVSVSSIGSFNHI